MIRSWRNSVSRKVWEGARPNSLRGLNFEKATDLLLALNLAQRLRDISPLNSVGLHKLKGERKDQWAMTDGGYVFGFAKAMHSTLRLWTITKDRTS